MPTVWIWIPYSVLFHWHNMVTFTPLKYVHEGLKLVPAWHVIQIILQDAVEGLIQNEAKRKDDDHTSAALSAKTVSLFLFFINFSLSLRVRSIGCLLRLPAPPTPNNAVKSKLFTNVKQNSNIHNKVLHIGIK